MTSAEAEGDQHDTTYPEGGRPTGARPCPRKTGEETTTTTTSHQEDAKVTTTTTTTSVTRRATGPRERLRPTKSASEMCSPREQRNQLNTLKTTTEAAEIPVSKVAGSLVFSVGHYRVQHLIGSGGAGRVYAGLDTRTGQTVALKICSKQLTDKQLERLRTEYSVMSNLQHRHIIKLHGVFENDSRMCLVMEHAEGGDLFEHIKSNGRLSRSESRRLFRQLTSALSHMHSQGYMHRDIKPENCLLDKQKNILLADFGFSNFWSSYKTETEGVGSLNYASPEIITSSASYIGPEVDLWSLGAVLYTMVTGRLPFYSSDPSRTLRKIRRGAWVVDETIRSDPDLFDILCRLLDPNPLKRATIWDVINHPYYKAGSKIIPSGSSSTTTRTSPPVSPTGSGTIDRGDESGSSSSSSNSENCLASVHSSSSQPDTHCSSSPSSLLLEKIPLSTIEE